MSKICRQLCVRQPAFLLTAQLHQQGRQSGAMLTGLAALSDTPATEAMFLYPPITPSSDA